MYKKVFRECESSMDKYQTGAGDGIGFGAMMLAALKGVALALVVATAMLLIISFALYSTGDPNRFVVPFAIVALALSGIAAGFFGSHFGGNVLSGLISGVLLMLLTWMLSWIAGEDLSYGPALPDPYSVLARLGIVVIALPGALLASRTRNRTPKVAGAPKIKKMKIKKYR